MPTTSKNQLRLTRAEFEALASAVGLAEVEFEDANPKLARTMLIGWEKLKADFYGDPAPQAKPAPRIGAP
jgi:hypothetical protein